MIHEHSHLKPLRKNPRHEWITRNRLHPDHAVLVASCGDMSRGPSGLSRKNPHAMATMGPNGIKRIDRLALREGIHTPLRNARRGEAVLAPVSQLPLVVIEHPSFYVVAVLDTVGGRLTSHDKDVLGQAHKLVNGCESRGAVVAVVFGECKETHFDLAGVDRLIHFQETRYHGYAPAQRVAALVAIEAQLQPRYWLFPDSVQGGAELGARLAAKLGERPAVNAWRVDTDSTVCRGGSQRIDIHRKTPRLLLLAEECAFPIGETRHQVLPIKIDDLPDASDAHTPAKQGSNAVDPRIEDCGQIAVDPGQIALEEAELVLSAGNGVHDWALFHKAAATLGASEGGSRVVVDKGLMPRHRQVGASGTWVAARVYISVGISGAIQHLQGIEQCDKVIAINTDADCAMVKRADLSVIGDGDQILSELIRLLEHRRNQEDGHVG